MHMADTKQGLCFEGSSTRVSLPLSQVQCTPPLCSTRCKQAHRASPSFKKSCQLSELALSAAAVVLPREWVFELYLGKLCACRSD